MRAIYKSSLWAATRVTIKVRIVIILRDMIVKYIEERGNDLGAYMTCRV